MKKTILLIYVAFSFLSAFSQEAPASKQRVYHSLGYSMFTNLTATPVKIYSWWNPTQQFAGYTMGGNPIYIGAWNTDVAQDFGITFLDVFYRFRYDIFEPNDNLSVGLSATPAIGVTYTEWEGGGSLNLPIQIELGFGAGSTYNSSAEHGGYIGCGVEINKMPLFYTGDPFYGEYPINFWAQPVISGGYRYWSKENKVKEINLKVGFSLNSQTLPVGSGIERTYPPIAIRLSWISFLNY